MMIHSKLLESVSVAFYAIYNKQIIITIWKMHVETCNEMGCEFYFLYEIEFAVYVCAFAKGVCVQHGKFGVWIVHSMRLYSMWVMHFICNQTMFFCFHLFPPFI